MLMVMAEDDEGTGNVGGPVAPLPARGQEWLGILSSVRCHLPRGWGTNPAEELKREAAAPGAGGTPKGAVMGWLKAATTWN